MIGFYSVLNFPRLQKVSNQSDGAADIPVVQRRESHVSLARKGRRGNECGKQDVSLLLPRLQASLILRERWESNTP